MYKIAYYRDKNGKFPVFDYIQDLEKKKDANKRARVKLDKIYQCLKLIEETGTSKGAPTIRNLEDNIYKIRALDSRLFFLRDEDTFVFLSHFIKSTQKTPEKEKTIARKRTRDYYLSKY